MTWLANFVLPLFATPYVAEIFSPLYAADALIGEILTFYVFQFRHASLWIVFAAVLVANAVPTLVGF